MGSMGRSLAFLFEAGHRFVQWPAQSGNGSERPISRLLLRSLFVQGLRDVVSRANGHEVIMALNLHKPAIQSLPHPALTASFRRLHRRPRVRARHLHGPPEQPSILRRIDPTPFANPVHDAIAVSGRSPGMGGIRISSPGRFAWRPGFPAASRSTPRRLYLRPRRSFAAKPRSALPNRCRFRQLQPVERARH